ncbi:MAG: peptide ABC transporter substrate-binding protein [Proteobacteria bacterium]|nr:peptide ABC transporter substrate-binding protein [Pseudomonadota bacterium]
MPSCRRPFLRNALILGLVLASLWPGARGAAARDLTIGITQFPSTFNPLIDSMMAKSFILGMTRRPVTAYDADWNLVCLLCAELPTLENGLAKIEPLKDGGEGMALTLKIHPDATWGDGVPVTAEDVVFTCQVGRHPDTGVGNFEAFRRILDVEVLDDKTVVLHGDRVTFDYNDMSGLTLLPAHLERPAFAEPREYRNRTLFDTDTANPGLYFGPYRITEVALGSHVVLERNETWWGATPAFDRITVRTIENTAALEANLLSGGIDYIAGELGLTVDQALAFEKRHGETFKVLYRSGLAYEHIDLNLDSPILKDRRVRRALLTAIDRAAISERLFEGRQPVANGFVNPLDWVHDPDLPEYPYDPAAAAALLDKAGWADIRGGIRHNAAGEPLRVVLMTTAGNRMRELVEQVLQSQWKQVGIETEIRNEPARVFFGETVTMRRFPHMAMFAWISSPENVPRTTQHSNQIPSEANAWAGQNYPGYSRPEVDDLIDAIEVELDRDKRLALWKRLQAIYAEELPVLPLYFRADPYVMPKWLDGVRPTGHQYPSTLWVEEWRVAE